MAKKKTVRVRAKDGVRFFPTIAAAARHYGINPRNVRNRVEVLGWNVNQALGLKPPPKQKPNRRSPLSVKTPKGIRRFDCIKHAAIAYGLDPSTVQARLKAQGWSNEQALGIRPPPPKPKVHNAKPVAFDVDGVSYAYPSVSDAAKSHGLSEFLVFGRMRLRGWTLAQALELAPPPAHTKRCYGYIYVITHNETGRQYVGQTMKPVAERWEEHRRIAAEGRMKNRPLSAAICKYGNSAFTVEQVATTPSYHDANQLERKWIARLNTMAPNGLNATRGGGGLSLGRAIKVAGTKYRSIADAAREYKLPPRIITERLGRGWAIGQAFGLEPEPHTANKRGQRITIAVDGKAITFKSFNAAARYCGVTPATATQRVRRCGWTTEEALGLEKPKSRWARKQITITIGGKPRSFKSVSTAAIAVGIDESLVYGRLTKGWTVDEAFGLVPRKKPQPSGKRCVVKIKGELRVFRTLSDAARENGLTLHLVSGRINNLGWAIEQALGIEPPPPKGPPNHASEITFAFCGRQHKYDSIADACRKHGLQQGTVAFRLRSGWSPEQAMGLEPPPSRKGKSRWAKRKMGKRSASHTPACKLPTVQPTSSGGVETFTPCTQNRVSLVRACFRKF